MPDGHDAKTAPQSLDLSDDPGRRAALIGIPAIDFRRNFAAAQAAGRGMPAMLRDVAALRFGPGRLTSNEYYYYRLWEPGLTDDAKRGFVGKLAQQPMHLACNRADWQAVAADKLLFHSLMAGAGMPAPELLAVAHPSRALPGIPALASEAAIVAFLREPANYPLFAKPIDGKYSLSVLSADRLGADGESLVLRGSPARASVGAVAQALAARAEGFLIQRRLEPAQQLAATFGDRLWSIRVLVLLTPNGPILHRATAKIPTGANPADNYWRAGNLLGALDLDTGAIERVTCGWADALTLPAAHPDTGAPLIGARVPGWPETMALVSAAAGLLPGIATQSWDIAVARSGPVILEMNFGGDLNLSQLASGSGTLDATYRAHLERHGYRLKS